MTPQEIRQARRELGLSSANAARLVGVRAATWQRWEAGARAVPEPTALLVHVLGRDKALLAYVAKTRGVTLP